MDYTMTAPCDQCPFLKKMSRGFRLQRLEEFAAGAFPCHKTADEVETEDGGVEFHANANSKHCAGALIYNEKRGRANQMMRIVERLGLYDASKLNMSAKVR
jgi:hypothetical protein